MTKISANYRFSGHETFPCRYAWLPKAVQWLAEDPALFRNEDQAMVKLGVGKNMVRGRAREIYRGEKHDRCAQDFILSVEKRIRFSGRAQRRCFSVSRLPPKRGRIAEGFYSH